MTKTVRTSLGVACALVLGIAGLFFEVRTVRGFVDENTGSRKGDSEWTLGFRTGEWYQESALETFMQKEFPSQLHQQWTPYCGNHENIYGGILKRGHGTPGLARRFTPEILAPYCAQATSAEKKKLYDALETQDKAAFEKIAPLVEDAYYFSR